MRVIIGKTGYFDEDTYIPLDTDPFYVNVEKVKLKHVNFLFLKFIKLSHFFDFFFN